MAGGAHGAMFTQDWRHVVRPRGAHEARRDLWRACLRGDGAAGRVAAIEPPPWQSRCIAPAAHGRERDADAVPGSCRSL